MKPLPASLESPTGIRLASVRRTSDARRPCLLPQTTGETRIPLPQLRTGRANRESNYGMPESSCRAHEPRSASRTFSLSRGEDRHAGEQQPMRASSTTSGWLIACSCLCLPRPSPPSGWNRSRNFRFDRSRRASTWIRSSSRSCRTRDPFDHRGPAWGGGAEPPPGCVVHAHRHVVIKMRTLRSVDAQVSERPPGPPPSDTMVWIPGGTFDIGIGSSLSGGSSRAPRQGRWLLDEPTHGDQRGIRALRR